MGLPDIVELDRRFGIPGSARVVEGNGHLAKVASAATGSAGEIYLHGAHLTSWKPTGAEEVLFVSSESRWENGRAIRGGVPICFPWFGGKTADPAAPAHGFVRTTVWQLESMARAGEAVTVTMSSESSEATKKWWPADFHVEYRVTLGSALNMELTVRNTGTSTLRFEEALHAYFRVGSIETVRIHGLNAKEYLDKTDSNRKKRQDGPIAITCETDRVYLNTEGPIELEDSSLHRRVAVAKQNSHSTVIWNPWIEKAKALSDFGGDEWKQMVCIETCNVGDCAVELASGQHHTMAASVRIL